jgi:sialic acid synthase SpsE
LQAIAEIKPGDILTEDQNIAILRPGRQTKGIHPRNLQRIVGRRAARAIPPGQGIRDGDWAKP